MHDQGFVFFRKNTNYLKWIADLLCKQHYKGKGTSPSNPVFFRLLPNSTLSIPPFLSHHALLLFFSLSPGLPSLTAFHAFLISPPYYLSVFFIHLFCLSIASFHSPSFSVHLSFFLFFYVPCIKWARAVNFLLLWCGWIFIFEILWCEF